MEIAKTRFMVINENMFGLVNPKQPSVMNVLRCLTSAPAIIDGLYPLPTSGVGPASRADFEIFRVSSGGYNSSPDYEFPTE